MWKTPAVWQTMTVISDQLLWCAGNGAATLTLKSVLSNVSDKSIKLLFV